MQTRLYKVTPTDSLGSIAGRFTGDPQRYLEILFANPKRLRTVWNGRLTFARALVPGELIAVPAAWGTAGLSGEGLGHVGLGATVQSVAAFLMADTTLCNGFNNNVKLFQYLFRQTYPNLKFIVAQRYELVLPVTGYYDGLTALALLYVTGGPN